MANNTSSQIITCKAAVCWGAGEPLVVQDIQVEPPQASEVRIKILCSSICHTDILYWKSEVGALFPRVLGHEGVGVVESVGEGVVDFTKGDHVIPTFLGECGECQNCTSMKTNFCLKYYLSTGGLMLDNTSRMSSKGQKLYHLFSCSTWSEYTVVDVNFLVKIDPKVPIQDASLISCGFSTGFGSVMKEAKIERGSSVAVFGLGAVGLGVIEGARMMGASKIIGVDLNEWKKDKGEIYGMTEFINPAKYNKPISEVIKDVTGGLGVEYCFECTGVESLVNQAFESTTTGSGVTIVIGVGPHQSVSIDFMSLILGKTIKGCVFGGLKPQSDFPSVIKKVLNKEINMDYLVTHTVILDDINEAFEIIKTQSDCLKVVIEMNNS